MFRSSHIHHHFSPANNRNDRVKLDIFKMESLQLSYIKSNFCETRIESRILNVEGTLFCFFFSRQNGTDSVHCQRKTLLE